MSTSDPGRKTPDLGPKKALLEPQKPDSGKFAYYCLLGLVWQLVFVYNLRMPVAVALPRMTNIHNRLVTSGWTMNFEGIRTLRPRQRYVGVQYAPEIREKLKWAKGESGFGTVLAMERKLEPVAVLQLWPTENESAWWVALNVPRRKAVYGYEKPIYENSWDRPARLLTDLRKSSFHGPDTDGALFYIREAPGYLTRNPWCTAYWSPSLGIPFSAGIAEKTRYGKISEFIGDVFPEACFVPYPPPETKPKTVNEWDGVVQRDEMQGTRQLALEYLARDCPWCRSTKDIMLAWDNNSGAGAFSERLARAKRYLELQYMEKPKPEPAPVYRPEYLTAWYQPGAVTYAGAYASSYDNIVARNINAPLKKAAPPPEPEIESKTGRLIILDDD